MKETQRLISLEVSGEKLRVASFEDKPHYVVPVIALKEGVIWPHGEKSPEYVDATVLAQNPSGWNGEPIVMRHPSINGQHVSANIPQVLEQYCFGRIFNTCSAEEILETQELRLEAWIDPERAKIVGAEAERAIERLQNGETVSVSVGAFVKMEEEKGEYKGKKYGARWLSLTPDHLAILPEEQPGACSVEMGCGASPTIAQAEEASMKKTMLQTLREKMAQILKTNEEGPSDVELRGKLNNALHAVEPGFMGCDEVFPADGIVIFSAMPEDRWLTIRREFSVAEDGTVTLGDKREEVQPVTRYEPVTAEGQPETTSEETPAPTTASCGCKAKAAHSHEGDQDMGKKEKVQALIGLAGSPFEAADEAMLMACTDERLAELTTKYTPKETPAPTTASAATPSLVEQLKGLTAEQFLEIAPESIRTLVAEDETRKREEKAGIVAELKDLQSAYSEDELKAMSLPQLKKLSAAFDSVVPRIDYSPVASAAPRPRVAAANGETVAKPASSFDRLRALSGTSQQ